MSQDSFPRVVDVDPLFSFAKSEAVLTSEGRSSASEIVPKLLKPFCGSPGESVPTEAAPDLWLCLGESQMPSKIEPARI